MIEATEAELVERISQGDQQAYRQVLDTQLPSLARYVSRMLNGATEAEDITQEVFLRLWSGAADFNPAIAKLTTWLHRIAHNLCVDYYRRRRPLQEGPPDQDLVGGAEPVAQLLLAITAADVKAALAHLPEAQRSALIMSHYQGLTNQDTAAVLGLSVEAVESLLARARRRLRQELAGRYDRTGKQ